MFSPIVYVIITNKVSVTILQSYISFPRHICKGVLQQKGGLFRKVIIAIFPSLTIVLSLLDVAITVF